jgi:hypothetical protein
MNISIIACPNGMGHFFRLLDIAKILSIKYQIFFFCTKKQKDKLKHKINNIKFIPMMENLNIDDGKIDFLINFYNKDLIKIKKFKDSKLIISDNLINKIYTKKNFLLISNFFWGKNFKLRSKKYQIYKELEKKFLKKNNVIQNRYFGQTYNKNSKKILINFTGKNFQISNKKKNKIFIYSRKKLKIMPLVVKLQSKYEFYSNNSSKKFNIKKYDLNNGLQQFKFLLGRPGLGSITDAIKFKVPILSYVEKNETNEILVNNKLIKKYRIGISLGNDKKKLDKVLSMSYKENEYIKYINNIKKFKFNGEMEILNYVKKI